MSNLVNIDQQEFLRISAVELRGAVDINNMFTNNFATSLFKSDGSVRQIADSITWRQRTLLSPISSPIGYKEKPVENQFKKGTEIELSKIRFAESIDVDSQEYKNALFGNNIVTETGRFPSDFRTHLIDLASSLGKKITRSYEKVLIDILLKGFYTSNAGDINYGRDNASFQVPTDNGGAWSNSMDLSVVVQRLESVADFFRRKKQIGNTGVINVIMGKDVYSSLFANNKIAEWSMWRRNVLESMFPAQFISSLGALSHGFINLDGFEYRLYTINEYYDDVTNGNAPVSMMDPKSILFIPQMEGLFETCVFEETLHSDTGIGNSYRVFSPQTIENSEMNSYLFGEIIHDRNSVSLQMMGGFAPKIAKVDSIVTAQVIA